MVDSNTETKDQVLKEDQLIMQTLTAMNRIDSDISQLYSPLYAFNKATVAVGNTGESTNDYSQQDANINFDGKTKNGLLIPMFFSEDKSSIQFLTTANRRKIADSKESRYAWVKYSLQPSIDEDDKKNGGNDLIRQILPVNIYAKDVSSLLKDPHSEKARAQVILTHVKSIEFSFWDERTKKYVTSLQELNENKNLIRSMKLELVWVDENQHEQKLDKTFRVLYPLFHAKQDDLNMANTGEGGMVPPPDPDQGIVQ